MSEFKLKKIDADKLDNLTIEHYKRCKDFCLSYNSTIWSMPSVATTINVGTYYAMFDNNKNIEPLIVIVTLLILTLLNFALLHGVKRHLHFQRQFGKRIMQIESDNGIPTIDLDSGNTWSKIKAGELYISSMIIISLISFIMFVIKLYIMFNPNYELLK